MTAKQAKKMVPRSRAFEAIHSAASDLHEAGLMDKATMREFDKSCLKPVPAYHGKDVKRIRERVHVSQGVLATYMNISVSTVQKWETDNRPIVGAAAKLLSIIERSGSIEAIA